MFYERLTKYRNSLNLNKKTMADKLEVSESYYSLLEGGKRSASPKIISKLVEISTLPEEYWIYGISRQDIESAAHEFRNLKKTLNTVFEFNTLNNANEVFDENNFPKDSLGKLLVAALKEDLSSMLEESRR